MSIKNYKSFRSKQNIEVGPITIFVGPNSAGKSSILKLLGFLHQNFHHNNSDGTLYKGKIVDLKNFASMTNNGNLKEIGIRFKTTTFGKEGLKGIFRFPTVDSQIEFKISKLGIRSSYNNHILIDRKYINYTNGVLNNVVKLSKINSNEVINKIEDTKQNYLKVIKVLYKCGQRDSLKYYNAFVKDALANFEAYCKSINFRYEDFAAPIIDGAFLINLKSHLRKTYSTHLDELPKLNPIRESLKNDYFHDYNSKYHVLLENKNAHEYLTSQLATYCPPLFNYDVKVLAGGGLVATGKHKYPNDLEPFDLGKDLFENILNIASQTYKQTEYPYLKDFLWRHLLKSLFTYSKEYFDKYSENLINIIQPTVESLLKEMTYIPPVRPTPKRFYTKKGLIEMLFGYSCSNTSNIERKGFNSLNEDFKNLNNYLKTLGMGRELILTKINHHSMPELYVIEVKDFASKQIHNFLDVGYGYSQILPILYNLSRSTSDANNTLVIEQPELHIHPKLQSSLADIIVNSMFLKNKSITQNTIVIETHSEHLVRKLMVFVAQGKLNKEDVVINYVGKYKNGNSYVKKMEIDDQGFFKNKWPEGFFDNSLKLTEELWTARKK